MSSAKAAAKPSRSKATARAAAKPAPDADNAAASAEAKRLAAALERGLAEGRLDVLSQDAQQALLAALCRTYSAQVETGSTVMPVAERGGVTSTDVMITASGLLKSANLAVFELGMWQSWTGR